MVAGAFALFFEANPEASADFAEQQMRATGKDIVDYRTGKDYPRVDILKAITETGLYINNKGADPLVINSVESETDPCWLDFNVDIPLVIDPLSESYIPINILNCVADGEYSDTLVITSNDEDNPEVRIPVDLYVVGGTPGPEPTDTPTPSPTPTDEPTVEPTVTNTIDPICPTQPATPTPAWCIGLPIISNSEGEE